ncbi:proP [Scenedesmus sp. PABB004]|nr:proP [Scenedesmus sp. PABB004]
MSKPAEPAATTAPPAHPHRGHPHGFGADLTRRQFVGLVIALCMGTSLEWYDFSVYSQLSATITAVFFPPTNPEAAAIGYWLVFAAGFVARPVGALVFGHVGDAFGRRISLLLSILCVSVPTVLIGCLPGYATIGMAAPALMGLFRFVQGLAVGGEFGSAIAYLFELAPPRRKGLYAALGQAAIAPGIVLGLLACIAVTLGCSPDALLVWGWRVPFLATVFFGPIALVLRMHMPEPVEFLASKEVMTLQRVASIAAAHTVAAENARRRSFGGRPARSSSGGGGPGSPGSAAGVRPSLSRAASRQLSRRLEALAEVVPADGAADAGGALSPRAPGGGGAGKAASFVALRIHSVGGAERGPAADGDAVVSDALAAAAGDFSAEVAAVEARVKHHVPIAVLMRHHWRSVALLALMEVSYGTLFYTFFSWVPSTMRAQHLGDAGITLWPVLVAMVLFASGVVASAHWICDGPAPKLWAFMALITLLAGVATPVLLWIGTGAPLAVWLCLPLMLGGAGVLGALMTSIGPLSFPPGVRLTGWNLVHNLAVRARGAAGGAAPPRPRRCARARAPARARPDRPPPPPQMSAAGIMPLVTAALARHVPPPELAAGVVLLLTLGVSWLTVLPLARLLPQLTLRAPAGVRP